MPNISTVSSRERQKVQHEPHWQKLSSGAYLGFRRLTPTSTGTWIARCRDPHTGKTAKRSLGDFDSLPASQRFDAATAAAREWFTHLGKGGATEASTIQDVCDRYVKHLRTHGKPRAADDAEKRFRSYVLNDSKLAALEVSKLTPAIVDKWRTALRERPTTSGGNRGNERTSSTLNRDVTPFRAALNQALDDGLVTTDFAWRVKLRPIKDADRQRHLYLDRSQRRKLIKSASQDVAEFLRGLCLLPLRPGALAALNVADFDKRLGALRIGKDKAGADRRLKLPASTAALFEAATRDKLPSAPVFARADGKAWNKDSWKGPVREAATAGGLPPATTAYTLRHSVITDLVHSGLDLLTVAQVSGTSVRMIEK